jgi:hypothetical protein
MALGADCIDDCDLLRPGQTRAGHRVAAPSTLGTFLRTFTFGHVRELDKVLAVCLERARGGWGRPRDERLIVDVDSFVSEVYGYGKQRAGYRYTHKRAYPREVGAVDRETAAVLPNPLLCADATRSTCSRIDKARREPSGASPIGDSRKPSALPGSREWP